MIKERLRRTSVDIPEIEQTLEDKYQSMKHVKGWEEEEDDYALFASQNSKKGHKNNPKGDVVTVESMDIKLQIVLIRKAIRTKVLKVNLIRKMQKTKKDHKEKGHKDMSKIKCYNCGEYDHYARDCLKPCNNMNIAKESDQNKEFNNMMDLDSNSICEECVMMCTDMYSQDEDEEIIVYGDQGISAKKNDKEMYGDLIKTDSEEEQNVKYNVALCVRDSVSLEKK